MDIMYDPLEYILCYAWKINRTTYRYQYKFELQESFVMHKI